MIICQANEIEGKHAMLNDFSCNIAGYILKHAVNPHCEGINGDHVASENFSFSYS